MRARRLRRVGLGLCGVVLALGAAELVFRARDENAFPHLRCYQADAELGLRLEPGRTERIRFGGAPATTIRIDAEGLRGAGLPPPSAQRDEVLVVGDSQAFGLGVEDDQTFSAKLHEALGKTVIDAGVPTYGPPEYEAMIDRWIEKRPIGVVVLTITFQNDFFEIERPNRERHEAWDGWAVRKGNAPAHVTAFPGRSWVYRDSHLFYAMRRAFHESQNAEAAEPGPDDPSTDSHVATVADFVTRGEDASERLRRKRAEEAALGASLAAPLPSVLAPGPSDLARWSDGPHDTTLLLLAHANPGDIVDRQPTGENAPLSLRATAATIAEGARLRQALEAKWQAANAGAIAAAQSSVGALRAQRAAFTFATSPMAQLLSRVGQKLRAKGVGFVVLGIPMDVMVFDDAWQKYGAAAHPDVTPIHALAEEQGAALAEEHVPWVCPEGELKAGGADVFMPLEFHLTAKGHAIVAQALAPWVRRAPDPLPRTERKPATSVYCARCQHLEGAFEVDGAGALHAIGVTVEGHPDLPGASYGAQQTVLDLDPGDHVALVGASELERFVATREAERWVVEATRLPRFARTDGTERARWAPPTTAAPPASSTTPCAPGAMALGPMGVCRTLCAAADPCAVGHSCVAYAGERVCKSDALDPAWTPPAAPPVPQTMGDGGSLL